MAASGRGEVLSLRGGIDAWKAAGLPIAENRRVPIPIMRQVQLVVGAMVLAGSVLAWLVSPWFLALTGFFGAGLLFAGATGTCGLAAVLGLMPWNRVAACPASNAP
jgi:rhodanese-related sulfurtransferase